MNRAVTSLNPAVQAMSAADLAMERAGVRIAPLDEIRQIEETCVLFNRVWGSPESSPLISVATLKALAHSGSYAFAAFDGPQIVGALVGFLGYHNGSLQLHSHMLGVSPARQGRRVGFALKQHQRAWAVQRDIPIVTWTFDPLVRRNAYFNITRLGAFVTRYYSNFYGEMQDGINGKDESDRVLVQWQLDSPQAIDASMNRLPEPDLDVLRGNGALDALDVGNGGEPLIATVSGETLLVRVPEDIVELRRRDNELARRWRLALRDVLGATLENGYVPVGMTRSGFYVLTPLEPVR